MYKIEYSTVKTGGEIRPKYFNNLKEAVHFFQKIRAKALHLAVYDLEDGVYLNW